ncbi:SDR family oxidoreductase [Celeribacter arenosi]|uniref:SDR family oxidoreductase n=1 Tax=Celeribacter arenosi TaxID=792649 RepID=A0ABP7KCV4_9RHOB
MPTPALKPAIVTGASKGIGAAIARRLAADGYGVVVNYAGSEGAAETLVAQIVKAGGKAIAVQADVSVPSAVEALFDACAQAFGAPEVLVNNAGIMSLAPLIDTDDASFDAMVAINLKGVFNCLRAGGRHMPDGARIVNISTTALAVNFPGYAAYCAAKAGVDAMTPIFAKELGPRGITVNGIAPGPVATELYLTGKSQADLDRVASMIPAGRIGEPDDIANTVAMIVSPDASWVNGQILRANGGLA